MPRRDPFTSSGIVLAAASGSHSADRMDARGTGAIQADNVKLLVSHPLLLRHFANDR